MPPQLTRLLLVFVLAGAAFVVVRSLLLPPSFGELGHYRAAAVDEAALLPIKYAGRDACTECHEAEATPQGKGPHQTLGCETCHGPGVAHVLNAVEAKPLMPRERTYCPVCHGYNDARPAGFPQIDPVAHNEGLPCIGCHNPHQADMPSEPESCAACHGRIAKLKAASKHVDVDCVMCHENADAHKKAPRVTRPTKPQDREFCSACHDLTATKPPGTVSVDRATHYDKYQCWQCHYPHDPEVL